MKTIALSELMPGQTALVEAICCPPALTARLEDLGLTPGLRVACLHLAPAGTPGAYEIRGAAIALRRRDAQRIIVREAET